MEGINRFKFQRIGRKEVAIIGEITVYKPSYELLTDSKGNTDGEEDNIPETRGEV